MAAIVPHACGATYPVERAPSAARRPGTQGVSASRRPAGWGALAPVVGSALDRTGKEARMAVGLMDIQGQYAELQERIESAVLEVLRSGRVILGPQVKGFEEESAAYLGTSGAVGVANGTDGLTIALRAMGIGPGDEVITVPFTFYATAEAIAQSGATPVFVDVLPDTLCIDPAAIAGAVTKRTKAVMPVDLFGLPAEMDAVNEIAAAHGLRVVEDACQAWGATYHGRRRRTRPGSWWGRS
jgi:dTDP-4-amino-4,6-dideoxygalactose transaminase